MRIHYIQHVPFEGLGYIKTWAKNSGYILSSTKMYEKPSFPSLDAFDWLIVMGGPMSVHDTGIFSWLNSEKNSFVMLLIAKNVFLAFALAPS